MYKYYLGYELHQVMQSLGQSGSLNMYHPRVWSCGQQVLYQSLGSIGMEKEDFLKDSQTCRH